MADRELRLGVAGLGRAFTAMLPSFLADRRVRLVAAADPREEARRMFAAQFGAHAYGSVEEMCGDHEVEAVYVATPHQFHAQHARLATANGKHVLVEKPMALTLEDCSAMTAAAHAAKVHLVVGHSHSFDAPIRRTREIIDGGMVGRVRMISALNYTDFLYRPRRPEELDTTQGGGVVFSQAAHQIDVVRLLGGGLVRSIRALTGAWDPLRPTEGAYAALLTFEDGAFASIVYCGYGRFDSDEFMGSIGEMGQKKDSAAYGAARATLRAGEPRGEASLKSARNYGGPAYAPPALPTELAHQHFGVVVVSCEKADLRPLPSGVMIYEDSAPRFEALPAPAVPRTEVIGELYDAIVNGRAPLHNGEWAMATLEVCLALLHSAAGSSEVKLLHQIGLSTMRQNGGVRA